MNTLVSTGLVVAGFVTGCTGGVVGEPQAPPTASGGGTRVLSVTVAPESMNVDRVGADDDTPRPNGNPDVVLVAKLEGPVSALFVVATDTTGGPSGWFQADTLSREEPMPKELAAAHGDSAATLKVWSGDQLLNTADGSLPSLDEGPHTLKLYVDSTAVVGGLGLRVYAIGPDRQLVAGPVVHR